MRLTLIDRNTEMVAAWKNYFGKDKYTTIIKGDLQNSNQSAIITAGNSFGLMSGGVDLAIAEHYLGIEHEIQKEIILHHGGELLVGNCVHVKHKQTGQIIIYAPTMQLPNNVSNTTNAYSALYAALNAVKQLNKKLHQKQGRYLNSVACPGLCTGTGQMDYNEAARQMYKAWENYQKNPVKLSWSTANARKIV